VTFDPFGDFKTGGYLRNSANESDLDIVRRLRPLRQGLMRLLRTLRNPKRLMRADVTRQRLLMPATYVRKSAKSYKGVRREKA
jgi:hypothetical protein